MASQGRQIEINENAVFLGQGLSRVSRTEEQEAIRTTGFN